MADLRILVEADTYPVPAEFTHDAVALLFGMGLDRSAKAMLVAASDDRGPAGVEDTEFMARVFTEAGATEVFSTDDPDVTSFLAKQVPLALSNTGTQQHRRAATLALSNTGTQRHALRSAFGITRTHTTLPVRCL